MKSLINNIYIFSKISVILVLMIIILSFSYFFYKSYKNQETLSNIKIKEQTVIADLISGNSNKIEKLSKMLNDINNNILDINSDINLNDNNKINDEITKILLDINNKIKILKSDIKKIQNKTDDSKVLKNNLIFQNKNEIIDLIKLKFENGKNFTSEINLLNQMVGSKKRYLLEKLYILNNEEFKGSEMLFIKFQNETDNYISEKFFSKNILIRGLFPYINIQPSKINNIENKDIMSLKNINKLIFNKKYVDSINLLKSLDKENRYFKQTLKQLNIGKSFYHTIEEISKNG